MYFVAVLMLGTVCHVKDEKWTSSISLANLCEVELAGNSSKKDLWSVCERLQGAEIDELKRPPIELE